MKAMILAGAALTSLAIPAAAQMGGARATTRAEAEAKVRERFAAADTDHDGYLTRDELHAAMAARRDEDRAPPMAETRDMRAPAPPMDDAPAPPPAEGDAAPHRMMAGHGGGGMGMMMLMMADADHDGRVSLKEAVDAALARFDRADANHDGTLTPEERAAARGR